MNTKTFQLDLHPAMITAASAMAASRDLTMDELMRDLLAREISRDMARPGAGRTIRHRPWLGTRKLGAGHSQTGTHGPASDFEVIEPF